MGFALEERPWWGYIEDDLRELLKESELLVAKAEGLNEQFHDYSFVVFPAAKAYEGYLKKIFLDMGFISEADFYGKRFRVGKALNPNLEPHLRQEESVYDRVVDFCQGRELADQLWEAWREGRNLIFHWFPKEKNALTFPEAKEKVGMILAAMDAAFRECRINK